MKKQNILLKIEKLPEGPYLGTSDDVQGLVVQADTVDEVINIAEEVAIDLLAVQKELAKERKEEDSNYIMGRAVYYPMNINFA